MQPQEWATANPSPIFYAEMRAMTQNQNLPRRSPAEQQRLEATLREMFEHRISFN